MPQTAQRILAFVLVGLSVHAVAARADEADDQYRVAAAHYEQGRWQLAAEEFEKFLANHASHAQASSARFYRGESLVQLGKYADAADQLHDCLKHQPEARFARKALFRAGEANYLGGRLGPARHDLTDFTAKYADDPLNAHALPYLGEIARAQGDPALAAKWFQQALDKYPQGPLADDCRYGLARALDEQKQPVQARPLYEQLVARGGPFADDALYALAASLFASEDFTGAEARFSELLEKHADSPLCEKARLGRSRTLAQLARERAAKQEWEQAADAYERFVKSGPETSLLAATSESLAASALAAGEHQRAEAWYAAVAALGVDLQASARGELGLAKARSLAGRHREAAAALDRLVEKGTDPALAAEAALLRGQALERAGQGDAALVMYTRVINQHATSPQMPLALLSAARLHHKLKQFDEAASLYQRRAKEFAASPDVDAVLYEHAWLERERGQHDKADALLERLRKDHAASKFWTDATYRLAQRALDNQKYRQAEALVDELLKANRQDVVLPHGLYLQAQCAARQGLWPQVAPPLERLLGEFPNHALALPARYWIAEAAYRAGRYDDAAKRLAEVDRLTQGRSDAWIAMIPLRRAQVLAQQSDWRAAQEIAVKIAERFPGFEQQYEVDYLVGRCLAAQAELVAAREKYAAAIRSPQGAKTETAAMAQWMIGESYMHQKDYEAALREYLKVEALYAYPTWQAAALLQAGKCQEFLNRGDEAATLYARVVKVYPQTQFKSEAAERLARLQTTASTKPARR